MTRKAFSLVFVHRHGLQECISDSQSNANIQHYARHFHKAHEKRTDKLLHFNHKYYLWNPNVIWRCNAVKLLPGVIDGHSGITTTGQSQLTQSKIIYPCLWLIFVYLSYFQLCAYMHVAESYTETTMYQIHDMK